MRFTLALLSAFFFINSFAQNHRQPGSSEIRLKIKKLNFLGSVLYVAAHPDDENTRAITYFVSDQLAATAYLAMTRGDGGQNLIGSEIRDQLGLIRTQELLSARRIDGGQQFFTRANDFGFSKNEKETFDIWNKNEILSDVVRVYRQFQPDVIITRFPPDARAGHGHHTASATLAMEAFEASGDAGSFPELARTYGTWQPKRLFINTGRWWNQTINEKSPGVVTVNMGSYNVLLGKSYSEIAAESRTQHKSQGFGSSGRRGDQPEYFELTKGDKTATTIFEGVNTTWSRIKGAEKIPTLVDQAVNEFKDENPVAIIPSLLKIRNAISSLPASVWKTRKENEVNRLIQDCLGLFVEVSADGFWAPPGEKIKASFEVINRSSAQVSLVQITAPNLSYDSSMTTELKNNVLLTFRSNRKLNSNLGYSDPYWLRQPHTQGLFTVEDQSQIGSPENLPAISFDFTFLVNNERLTIRTPLINKITDPVKGEVIRPFEIVPPAFVNLDKPVYLFNDQSPREVRAVLKSAKDNCSGKLELKLPQGWRSEPASYLFETKKKGEEQTYTFKVLPAKEEVTSAIRAVATIDGKEFDYSLETIQYDHIPTQTLLPKASSAALRLDLKRQGSVIGYIKGAGDEIPAAMRNMGYEVWEMRDDEVTPGNLKKVDAVVLGIRALNTNERIRHFMPALLDFTKEGGTMVVQYNTNSDLEIAADKFSPFPITMSRDRVTQENSEVRILKPDHPLLNSPNKITSKDFEGWVQERGLYFPSAWSAEYDALLSMNDAGEPAKDGSLLVANYGNGHYVYTSLSFFRELPEGVVGAYKLFANLVSMTKTSKPADVKVKSK
ncbi:GlcNAc-PI de-N-acetylase [Cytophagales bacterium WSM2-2]|nr:GlcNAc-PI de-N-acetylase [Cytophagales bacterium WSM2-2]